MRTSGDFCHRFGNMHHRCTHNGRLVRTDRAQFLCCAGCGGQDAADVENVDPGSPLLAGSAPGAKARGEEDAAELRLHQNVVARLHDRDWMDIFPTFAIRCLYGDLFT